MTDPVSLTTGHSYDRACIEKWFADGHSTDPVNNVRVDTRVKIPNHALRNAIQLHQTTTTPTQTRMDLVLPSIRVQQTTVRGSNKICYSFTLSADQTMNTPGKHIIAVLDVSGSMGSRVSNEYTITRLDLVKHAMKTMIRLMRPTDLLTMISFSDTMETVLTRSPMTESNKTVADQHINQMHVVGGTNLWGGLLKGLELAGNDLLYSTIMVFTDGERSKDYDVRYPGMFNPQGETDDQLLVFPQRENVTIHTLGFGNSLDRSILSSVAKRGNGQFCYISDGGMVGNIFIYLLMNTLFIQYPNVQMRILSEGRSIQLGDIRPNQTKTLTLDLPVTGSWTLISEDKDVPFVMDDIPGPEREVDFDAIHHSYVNLLEQTLLQLSNPILYAHRTGDTMTVLDKWTRFAIQLIPQQVLDPRVFGILEDIESSSSEKGQIVKAIHAKDTWGLFYLTSIWFAHSKQVIANFKDASMKMYCTPEMTEWFNRAVTLFTGIDPPRGVSRAYVAQHYMNQSSGCFTGDSLVELANGMKIQMKHLQPNMKVKGGFPVRCVVKYKTTTPDIVWMTSTFGITPYHPFRKVGESLAWRFPMDVKSVKEKDVGVGMVYNAVLDRGHVLNVEGYECVTLGHGKRGKVVGHTYFGTQKCVEDLKRMDGFEQGVVCFEKAAFVRNASGLICSVSETTFMM